MGGDSELTADPQATRGKQSEPAGGFGRPPYGPRDQPLQARASGLSHHASLPQRRHIADAMAGLVGQHGYHSVSVAMVVARAHVSTRTFYLHFENLQTCFLSVLDDQAAYARRLVTHAFAGHRDWRAALRAVVTALLVHLDAEPLFARVWLVEVLAAGGWALERRAQHIERVTALIVSSWPLPDGWRAPPLAAEGVMASVLGVLHAHLLSGSDEPCISLLGPLVGTVTRPYLPGAQVEQEMACAEWLAREIRDGRIAWPLPGRDISDFSLPSTLVHPAAHRARACIRFIACHPGASNRQVGTGIGIGHAGQTSSLLARLMRLGLITRHPGAAGHPHAWRLTSHGERVAESLA